MIRDFRVLAIVPARGGSKGVPRKNIRMLGGNPLIGWAITAAQASALIDRVIVSSDDDEICAVAARYGEDVVLRRPAELATDEATSLDVVLHAVAALPEFDIAVLLQPTSPLRTAPDIDCCVGMMVEYRATSCVSVCLANQSPYWMYRRDDDGRLTPLLDDANSFTRRQDLPPVFVPNGAVYAFRIEWLRSSRRFIDVGTLGYVMPHERSIDIDTEADLVLAEQTMLAARPTS